MIVARGNCRIVKLSVKGRKSKSHTIEISRRRNTFSSTISCRFGGKKCSAKDFAKTLTPEGVCFTFNNASKNAKTIQQGTKLISKARNNSLHTHTRIKGLENHFGCLLLCSIRPTFGTSFAAQRGTVRVHSRSHRDNGNPGLCARSEGNPASQSHWICNWTKSTRSCSRSKNRGTHTFSFLSCQVPLLSSSSDVGNVLVNHACTK